MPDKIIEGRVDLNIQQLEKLIANLKLAKFHSKDFSKEIDSLNSFLSRSIEVGESVPKAYSSNLAKIKQDIPEISNNIDKLLNESNLRYIAETKSRIGYIKEQLKNLELNKSKYTKDEYDEKVRIYELEEKTYVKEANTTKILEDRFTRLKYAKFQLNKAQEQGLDNSSEEAKKYDAALKSNLEFFTSYEDKLLGKGPLKKVREFNKLLEDSHDTQSVLLKGSLKNILNFNVPIKSFQEELDKRLMISEAFAEKEAKLFEKLGENAAFADRPTDDIVDYVKPLEESFEKAESAIVLFQKRFRELKTTSIGNISTVDYSNIDDRTALLKNEQGTSIYGLYDKYMSTDSEKDKVEALKKLSAYLTKYGEVYKTVGADEISILEKITSLNVIRGRESEFYGNQAVRTANRIIERSKQEVSLYTELNLLDQKLANNQITREEYEKSIDGIVKSSQNIDIEKIEFFANRLKTLLSGNVFVGDNVKFAEQYKGLIIDIVKGSENINVPDSAKTALVELSAYFEQLDGKSKELIGDLPKLLRELSGIEKIQDDLSGKKLVDFETLGDPTTIAGMESYVQKLNDLVKLRSESQAGTGRVALQDEALAQDSIDKVLEHITRKYKDIKNDKEKLAKYSNDDLYAMSRLREVVNGVRHTNGAYAKDTLNILDNTRTIAKQEAIILSDIKKKAAEEERQAKIKDNHAKKYILDAEELSEKQALFDKSRITNIVILRDKIDELSTRFELLNTIGGVDTSKQTAWSVRELTDTIDELGRLKKVKDETGKETGKEYYEVVSKDQIKYLEEIRRFLVKNSAIIVEESENTGVTNTKLKSTVKTLTEIIARSENINDLDKIRKNSTNDVKENINDTSKAIEDMSKKANKNSNLLDKVFKSLGHAFGKVILYTLVRNAIRKIGEAIRFVVSSSIEYEQSLANVSAVSSATASELAKLNKAAIKAGTTTRYSAIDAANALYYMAQAGYSATESIEALNGVLVLAQATGENVEQTSELMAATMSQFGMSTLESDKIANIFAASINKSMSSLDKLQTSLRQAGPVAGAMNVSLEDTVGLLDMMYNNGIEGSRAGRALRNTFAEMSNPTGKLSKEIEKLGLDFSKVNLSNNELVDALGYLQDAGLSTGRIMQMFGKVIGPQMTVVLKSTKEELQDYIKEVSNTNHAYEAMEIQNATLRGDMDKLKASLTSTGASLGELFNKPARVFVQFLKNAVLNIKDFIEKTTGLKNMSDNLNETITGLSKNVDEYSYVVMKLNDKNNKLSVTEEKLLNIRKQLLELEYVEFAKELSDEYDEVIRQTEAFGELSVTLSTVEVYAKQYEYTMRLIDNITKITDKDSLEYKYSLNELNSAYNDLVTYGIKANNAINSTKSVFRDMEDAKEFINVLNTAQKTMNNFKMPIMYDKEGNLAILQQDIESMDAYLSLYTQLAERPDLRFISDIYSGITLFDEKTVKEQIRSILEIIADGEDKVNTFNSNVEDGITNVARLIKSGLLTEDQIAFFDPKLLDRIRNKVVDLGIVIDDIKEGQWLDFDFDEESFSELNSTIESSINNYLSKLDNGLLANTEYIFGERTRIIEESIKNETKAIEDRYNKRIDEIDAIDSVNEAEEEAIVIATAESKEANKLYAERLKQIELDNLAAFKKIKLADLAYEKKQKGIELDEKEKILLEEREQSIKDLLNLEINYANKLKDLYSSDVNEDSYSSNLALLKLKQQEEKDLLEKQNKDKLKEIEDNKNSQIELEIKAYNESIEAREAYNTTYNEKLLAKLTSAKKYNQAIYDYDIAKYQEDKELSNEQMSVLLDYYEKYKKHMLAGETNLADIYKSILFRNSADLATIMMTKYNNDLVTQKEYDEAKLLIDTQYQTLQTDSLIEHNNNLSEIDSQAEEESLAAQDYFNKEKLDAELYFQLQQEQLRLKFRQKALDNEKENIREGNKNSFKALTDKYKAEKELRLQQHILNIDEAKAAYDAEFALTGDGTTAFNNLTKLLFDNQEKFREENKAAQKAYLDEMLNLSIHYAETVIGVYSDLTGKIEELNKVQLENKLSQIDENLKNETDAITESHNRKLIEDGFMGNLAKLELERLDAEVEAARQAGDEEARIAAETALKKYLINEYAHQEKLQELDDAINQAMINADTEAILEAQKNKEKYLADKEYEDSIKALEEQAAKEKAQLEYESALRTWKIQSVQIIADAAVAIMKAWQAGWPLSLLTVPAAIVGTGVQLAAHQQAMPKPPEFDTGGIVLGSSEGTIAKIGEKNKTELISNPEQMANMLLAIGNNGLNNKTLTQTIIFITEDKKEIARYTVEDVLNKGVMTIDAKKAIRKGGRI